MAKTEIDFDAARAELSGRIAAVAELVSPDILQPADLFFDLAGEDIGRRLMLTSGPDGTAYCLRPDFTLPIAAQYLASGEVGQTKSFGYLGPVFRQRDYGPFEFDQAGLEFLAPINSDKTFTETMHFAIEACALYGETTPRLHLGAVDLFETLLAKIDLPDVWRPRVRDRFGHDAAMGRLLDRLAVPDQFDGADDLPQSDDELTKKVAADMEAAGLSPYSGRQAEEIVARYREKQMLAKAAVPAKTVRILREFLSIAGPAHEQAFRVAALAKKVGIDLEEPLEKLMGRLTELKAAAPKIEVEFDAGFSPRLDYYTGHVFELTANKTGEVLASGGQYDRLLERMGASDRVSAVGCAIWLDRLEQGAMR